MGEQEYAKRISEGLTQGQAFALTAAVRRGKPWCRCWYAGMSRASRRLEALGLVSRDERKASGTWVIPTDLGRAVARAIEASKDPRP